MKTQSLIALPVATNLTKRIEPTMLTATFLPFWTVIHCVYDSPDGPQAEDRLIFKQSESDAPELSSPIRSDDIFTNEVITHSGSRYLLSALPHEFEEEVLSHVVEVLEEAGRAEAELRPELLAVTLH